MSAAHGATAALGTGAAVDDGFPGVALAALPPHTLAAARGNVLRCEAAVQGWVPFFGDLRVFGGEIVEARQHLATRAIGAAVAALGAAGHHGLIVVALRAAPPDLAIAGWGDLRWQQGTIFFRMPFSGEVRVLTGEVVVASDDDFAGAHRTAAAVDTAGDAGLPGMAFGALPPDTAVCTRHHVARREGTVFGGMPLLRKMWVETGQVVITLFELFVGADGTTGAIHPRFDLRAPCVAFGTAPPNKAVTARQHLTWCEIAVFLRMPLFGKCRMDSSQIVFACNGITSGTIGTACATTSSGMNRRLPAVPICAAPPNTLFAAMGHSRRCKRCVARSVPLAEKLFSLCAPTKIKQ